MSTMRFDAVIVAGGSSLRFGENKLFLPIANQVVLERTIEVFYNHPRIDYIILVYKRKDYESVMSVVCDLDKSRFKFVIGGSSRTQSVENGLKEAEAEGVLIHDGARPFVSPELIDRVMESVEKYGSGVPAKPAINSLRTISGGAVVGEVDRENVVSVSTPQGFITEQIRKAFDARGEVEYTDESILFAKEVAPAHIVKDDEQNAKITTLGTYYGLNANIGFGYDLHPLTHGRKFVLCGVELDYPLGPMAVSDGDAGIHALIDALYSAIGERDIGVHFPENDPRCDGMDSAIMLSEVMETYRLQNRKVSNAAIVLILDKPKLKDYIPVMRVKLARLLGIPWEKLSISAKTTEGTLPNTVQAYATVLTV